MTFDAVIDHLWQSTLVAAAIALLTLAFRRTRAETRYWIWLAASLKFLIPFAALTSLGSQFKWRAALPAPPQEWTLAFETVSQPLLAPEISIALPRVAEDAGLHVATLAGTIWILGCAAILTIWLLRWRRVSAAVRAGAPITSGRIHDAFHRLASSSALPLISSDSSLEPGVFGIARPVLLWPRDIELRLDDAQVHAILAHELAHVRRRDNLTAAVHMVVEAMFWFHPLVWWIGTRLVDERERACDEEVVRLGSEPHVYAESILRTCQFSIESPLPCVPGVTGSDLKKRIVRIMTHRPGTNPGPWGKAVLLTGAAVVSAAPVVMGALTAPQAATSSNVAPYAGVPSFEVASVKPNKTGDQRMAIGLQPGARFNANNVPLRMLLRQAYDVQDFQIVGGPDWVRSLRFDVVAKTPEGEFSADEMRPMLRALLEKRFELRVHHETRDMPIYVLTKARPDGAPGPSIAPAAVDCAAVMQGRRGGTPPVLHQPRQKIDCGLLIGIGRMNAGGMPMINLARSLSPLVGRIVLDETELTGGYDFELTYAPEGLGAPTIFTALQEQLGLKLEPGRAPVDVLVIDSAEQPTED